MNDAVKILQIGDDPQVRQSLERQLRNKADFSVVLAESGAEALKVLAAEDDVRVIILSSRRADQADDEFLRQVEDERPDVILIRFSDQADGLSTGEIGNFAQAYELSSKAWTDQALFSTISSALKYQDMQREVQKMASELQKKNTELLEINNNLEKLISKRTETLEIRNQVLQIAQGILDVVPVVIFGIDPEQVIVHCNEAARDLFPYGGIGPLGHLRQDVFPPEVNGLIDRLKGESLPKEVMKIFGRKYRGEVRRLHETLSQGIVLTLIPES